MAITNAQIEAAVPSTATGTDADQPDRALTQALLKDLRDAAEDVSKTGTNAFTGANSFSQPVTVATPTANGHATTKTYVDTAINGRVPTSRTVAGKALTGNITLAKGDVGLGNVDNTSDVDKPLSTPTKSYVDNSVNQKANIEANTSSLPIVFDIARSYGTYTTPATGNLGWVASAGDKRVTIKIIHEDSVAPTELDNMINLGSNTYTPSAKNLLVIECFEPNAAYFYQVYAI